MTLSFLSTLALGGQPRRRSETRLPVLAGESLRFGATYCAGSGFFEAQGRPSNAPLAFSSLARALRTAGITNIEMESGPILRLAHEWGARALVIAVTVADREGNVFADATAYERGTRDAVRTAIEILGA
jgi:uridine phosphorylase